VPVAHVEDFETTHQEFTSRLMGRLSTLTL